jgi:hypothetical protein
MTLTDLDRYGYMTIKRESNISEYIFAMNLTDNPGHSCTGQGNQIPDTL